MQRLEVSGAVRHVYIYMYVYIYVVRRQRVILRTTSALFYLNIFLTTPRLCLINRMYIHETVIGLLPVLCFSVIFLTRGLLTLVNDT
jgi:hypothetical protein